MHTNSSGLYPPYPRRGQSSVCVVLTLIASCYFPESIFYSFKAECKRFSICLRLLTLPSYPLILWWWGWECVVGVIGRISQERNINIRMHSSHAGKCRVGCCGRPPEKQMSNFTPSGRPALQHDAGAVVQASKWMALLVEK